MKFHKIKITILIIALFLTWFFTTGFGLTTAVQIRDKIYSLTIGYHVQEIIEKPTGNFKNIILDN